MLRRVYPYYVMYLVKYFPILPLCHNPSVHINEFSANLNSTFYLFSSVMIHILLCDVMFFTQDSPINLSMKIPWVIFFPVELCCFTCRTMADGLLQCRFLILLLNVTQKPLKFSSVSYTYFSLSVPRWACIVNCCHICAYNVYTCMQMMLLMKKPSSMCVFRSGIRVKEFKLS